jgi:4-hydroxybenzoyl-CoA thioesterase
VRFAHCDPAGIIFYPQYLMLAHEVKEDWLREGLGYPLEQSLFTDRKGLPVVRLEVDFSAPSRLGEELLFQLEVVKVGRTSVDTLYSVFCGETLRCRIRSVDVRTDLETGEPVEWEPELREKLLSFYVELDA